MNKYIFVIICFNREFPTESCSSFHTNLLLHSSWNCLPMTTLAGKFSSYHGVNEPRYSLYSKFFSLKLSSIFCGSKNQLLLIVFNLWKPATRWVLFTGVSSGICKYSVSPHGSTTEIVHTDAFLSSPFSLKSKLCQTFE